MAKKIGNLAFWVACLGAYSILFLLFLSYWNQHCQPELRHPMYGNTLPKRIRYPKRVNMGKCPPLFGRIMVFIVGEQQYKPMKSNYALAQDSLDCYLRGTNYTLKRVDLNEDERAKQYCMAYKNLYFRKHCIASAYLEDTDWMLVLDADTGVVNPNHCIEEWIDERVDLIFYERFFDWEIVSGNYLVKNTQFSRKFLIDWANYEFSQPKFSSSDNGALQLHVLKTVLPDAQIEINACSRYWNRSDNFDALMAYTICVRAALGAQRIWPPKVRILRRAHGYARDGFMTEHKWSERDFLFHGWKSYNSNFKTPFTRHPNATECTGGYTGWHWHKDMKMSVHEAKNRLAHAERAMGRAFSNKSRIHAHLEEPDVGECYPRCDEHI